MLQLIGLKDKRRHERPSVAPSRTFHPPLQNGSGMDDPRHGMDPRGFSPQGYTALMRARLSEAIVAFSLQTMVLEAEALRHAATAAPQNAEAMMEGKEEIQSPTHTPSDSEAEPTKTEGRPANRSLRLLRSRSG